MGSYKDLLCSDVFAIEKWQSSPNDGAYTPCAIYAKKDISRNVKLELLCGVLAQCNEHDMEVYDDHSR